MKIKNMNAWLATGKPYFTVNYQGEFLGNYSTEESAQKALNNAKGK